MPGRTKRATLSFSVSPEVIAALKLMAQATRCESGPNGRVEGIKYHEFAAQLLEVAVIEALDKRFGKKLSQLSNLSDPMIAIQSHRLIDCVL